MWRRDVPKTVPTRFFVSGSKRVILLPASSAT